MFIRSAINIIEFILAPTQIIIKGPRATLGSEFNMVKYIVHVLKPIVFDSEKSVKQNSIDMAKLDYEQKKEAYEKAYGKKLLYDFDYSDIVGLKN